MNIKAKFFWLGGRILRIIPPNTVIRILSGINKGMKWVRGAANGPEWLGLYETEHQDIINTIVKSDMVVYDIGANAGFFTLAFSRIVGCKGRVVAFEPLPSNTSKLLRHLHLNKISNTTVLPIAIGAEQGLQSFTFGNDNFTGRLENYSKTNFIIPVMSLDDLVQNEQVPLPNIIKMDIEGGELDALHGAKGILSEGFPLLIISLHGEEQTRECCRFIRKLGYYCKFFGKTQEANTDIYAYKKKSSS